ncbi:YbhB/YbcL family Raf kinase inhibitor-like protein [Haloarcula sp. S1CR25-12]|uniref:YbhB/YbcL family Raf kinase inhibitor-like protein n=1 Tax=Haloarcula saliterrae TaxID=2950534 RepID=A0ABU2FAV6_9EURY|nr:YbhB/YbcL family Raf kinase inhibitor-like protein [Haloarcula sp. S1CR25-12]MDS0258845.1 YbhB/YbcL family Raf kinase inhibitor-like protein [Haloarcula sp. S1CR25-12]
MRRRQLLGTLGTAVAGGVAGCGESAQSTPGAFRVSSPALESGGKLPARFTCDGAGRSPPFVLDRVPEPTAGLAVIAEYDRGIINEPVFWTLWNVPPETERIPAGLPRTGTVESLGGARQGRPEGGEVGYEPPCPPTGQPYEHRFQVYALGETVDVAGGTDHDTAGEAIGDAVLASARFTVDYERTPAPA